MDLARRQLPRFDYHPSVEQREGRVIRHPVVIVGGGLVGLTLACDLACRGIASILLDEDDTIGVRGAASRGICYARKSLQIFDRLGIGQRMRDKGVTWSVGRVLDAGGELYAFDLAQDPLAANPPFVNLQQYYVEWFLVERLQELGLTDIRWKNKVVAAEAGTDHVAFQVETPDGAYRVEADWAIACDGVHSPVRESLGLDAHREAYRDHWCITDVAVKGLADGPNERMTWVEADFNAGKGLWKHKMADEVWRLDFQIGEERDIKAEAAPDRAMARARAVFPEPAEIEAVSIVPWTYYTQVIDDFRHGRLFFAGDAAHAFSSFGARGGNSGIQDAENLAWKLAAVLNGQASETLLDSYTQERRPAALHNIAVTRKSSRFMAPRNKAETGLRRAILALARKHAFARPLVNTGRLSDPYVYPPSHWIAQDGRALDDIRLRDGGTLLDQFPARGGFRAILHGAPAPDVAVALAVLTQDDPAIHCLVLGAEDGPLPRCADADMAIAHRLALMPGQTLLLRPDDHICARLDAPDAENLRILRDTCLDRR